MVLRRKDCKLNSEKLLEKRGLRCFIVVLHSLVLLLGIASVLFGAVDFLSPTSLPTLPRTNCTLTATIRTHYHFPLKFLPLLTGMVLILIDVSVLCLFLIVKSCGCGRLAVAWHLIITTCVATWTIWSALYLSTLAPYWLKDQRTCDSLVVGVAVGGAVFMGVISLVYLTAVLVALFYECCSRRTRKPPS